MSQESKKTSFTITFRDGKSHSVFLAPKGIIDGFWMSDKDKKLDQTNGLTVDVFFGESVKIQIETAGVANGTKIHVKVKAKIGVDDDQDFEEIEHTLEVKDNTAILEDFYINPKWYNEKIENYDFKAHQTEIDSKEAIAFVFDTKFEDKDWDESIRLPKNENDYLKPITYRRNYEELIGLYAYEDLTTKKHSKAKNSINNFENHYIKLNSKIEKIVTDFTDILVKESTTTEQIENEIVPQKAKALWDAAVKGVQGYETNSPFPISDFSEKLVAEAGLTEEDMHKVSIAPNLDDRPLYWARNKMQVYLKRHPKFKDDFDFQTSVIKKDSRLERIIILFEELSRNYSGSDIDFSKAPKGMKKLLITGFDPFSICLLYTSPSPRD